MEKEEFNDFQRIYYFFLYFYTSHPNDDIQNLIFDIQQIPKSFMIHVSL